MLVYRMEHKRLGLGPFRPAVCTLIGVDYDDHNREHMNALPTPVEEGLFTDTSEFREYSCGCTTLKQLRYWFKYSWDKLLANDMQVVRYKLKKKDVKQGKHQVLFIKERAINSTCLQVR